MTMMVLTAAYVSIDSQTYHNRCKKVELTVDVEEKDVTHYASLGWKEVKGGIKSGGLGFGFFNDHDAGGIDELMWANIGEVVPFEVRHTQDAISTSNPAYKGNLLLKEWKPINGGVGDVNELDVSWPTSGQITRDVTP